MTNRDWDRVVEEIGPRLHRYFDYKGARDHSADLTQETLIRLVRLEDRFDPGKGPLVAFALGIAQNVWKEAARKSPANLLFDEIETASVDPGPQERLERASEAEYLQSVVRRLPSIQQDVLYLYFDEEITTREISEILEMPEGTVKSHLHRAKESIRAILERRKI